MPYIVRTGLTLFFLAALTACEAARPAPDTDVRRAIPEEVQRAAYAECAQDLRLPLHVHKLKRGPSGLTVFGSDGSGVLVAEARALNLCANAKLDALMTSD